MIKWLRILFLVTGFTLLLFHNMVPHHHDDDDKIAAHHHPHDLLEHIQVDHIFFHSFQQHFDLTPTVVLLTPPILVLPEPTVLALPQITWMPEKPHLSTWSSDQTILRGPPSEVNAAV